MLKWSIHQDDMKIVNTYALNITDPKYIKQILTNRSEGRNKQYKKVSKFGRYQSIDQNKSH